IDVAVALVPLRSRDQVVRLHVDQRPRPRVRGLIRGVRCRVVDGEPLAVCTRHACAAARVDLLGGGRAAVRSDGRAQTDQSVEIDEVLLAAAVERDVGVAASGWRLCAGEGTGRWTRRDGPEAATAVDRAEPDTPLSSG